MDEEVRVIRELNDFSYKKAEKLAQELDLSMYEIPNLDWKISQMRSSIMNQPDFLKALAAHIIVISELINTNRFRIIPSDSIAQSNNSYIQSTVTYFGNVYECTFFNYKFTRANPGNVNKCWDVHNYTFPIIYEYSRREPIDVLKGEVNECMKTMNRYSKSWWRRTFWFI